MTDVHLFILALLTAATPILANAANSTAVTVLQSLNNQLPLVARIGQPYSWTISPLTFSYAGGGSLNYTTSALPGWVSFDASTQTFRGTPSVKDVGYPEVTLTAHAAESSASSKFTICVTRNPAPTLKLPLEQQFVPNSRSLSSVYFLRNSSAIITPHPALRIPRKWSFSIGMESNMFLDAPRIFYELRLANGSAIPDYLNFNSRTVTLDGVIPPAEKLPQPSVISCVLHASDQEGYTATLLPFDLVVADHELSLSEAVSLPTINITIASPFVASLSSAMDYMGVLVDGDPIQPLNISSLDIDVSNHPWLQYDKASRTLFGTPGVDVTGTSPALPVTLTTTFNQSIVTSVSLNLVESYFVLPVLPSLHVSQGDTIVASLTPWLSKSNSRPGYDGTSLIASYDPTVAADFLYFDEPSANVTGTIPSDYHSASDHITLSFTAYSNVTHTTSHTSLAIYVPNTGNTQSLAPSRADGQSDDAHKKLVLALGLSFGLIGGLCVLAGIFAVVRRWAKVEDTAIVGEEGRRALSEKDQRWYGMALSPGGTRVVEKEAIKPVAIAKPRGPRPQYGGLGLRRASEMGQGNTDSQEHLVGQGVMRKKEFLARIKETVRQVSNKYSRKQDPHSNRPAIGKPILVSSTRASENHPEVVVHSSPSNPFDDSLAPSRPGSTFLSSPSGSTAEQSIPRRRADFGGPRNPAQVHFKEGLLVRHPSTGSAGDVSYRSGKSGVSGDSVFETEIGPQTRPRLVPFTSSTRVPVPDPDPVVFTGNRIASQRAKVCKTDFGENCEDTGIKASDTADDLSMGLHYMRSLGTDQPAPSNGGGNGSSSLSNVRSSFTSLESSHVGHKTGMEMSVTKVLIRVGERFKFRVPIFPTSGIAAESYAVKLVSGEVLPRFIQPDLNGISTKGVLELSGIATFRDLGGLNVGVYTNTGACVASVIIEVVGK